MERVEKDSARVFGIGKEEWLNPQTASQKLNEMKEKLSKKSDYLGKKIEQEIALVKERGVENKRGKSTV